MPPIVIPPMIEKTTFEVCVFFVEKDVVFRYQVGIGIFNVNSHFTVLNLVARDGMVPV